MSISAFRTLAFVAFAVITAPLFSQGTCEIEGLFGVDECGVPNGDNSSCLDDCGVINGDNSTCLDDCGVPNGENSTCAMEDCGTVTFDGYSYATVVIGTQCWFSENLRSDHYLNGDAIPGDLDDAAWSTSGGGAQAYYDNDPAKLAVYGRLYNMGAVSDWRGLCPSGWHVPSDAEYLTLTDVLGGTYVAGGKMKEAGYDHWDSPNAGATNSSGFTALGGGYRFQNGSFHVMGYFGCFWSSSYYQGHGWYRELHSIAADAHRTHKHPRSGLSVRCVQD